MGAAAPRGTAVVKGRWAKMAGAVRAWRTGGTAYQEFLGFQGLACGLSAVGGSLVERRHRRKTKKVKVPPEPPAEAQHQFRFHDEASAEPACTGPAPAPDISVALDQIRTEAEAEALAAQSIADALVKEFAARARFAAELRRQDLERLHQAM